MRLTPLKSTEPDIGKVSRITALVPLPENMVNSFLLKSVGVGKENTVLLSNIAAEIGVHEGDPGEIDPSEIHMAR